MGLPQVIWGKGPEERVSLSFSDFALAEMMR
jgi:hypothetical protein